MSAKALPVVPLEYDFDEEAEGFGEPPRQPPPPLSLAEKLSLGAVGVGLLALVVLVLLGSEALLERFGRTPSPAVGTWWAFLLAFALPSVGAAVYYFAAYRDTAPGIKNDANFFRSAQRRGAVGWTLGVVFTGFYVLLYWWPSYLEGAVRLVDPLASALSGKAANQWFLYGLLYTLAVLVFGVRMAMKYRHNRYQLVRTASVAFFQLGFAFLLPQVLRAFKQPEVYFTYFWPLKYDYLFPSTVTWLWEQPGGVGAFMVFWGGVMTFVATPILTYFFGKRWYCSWVCGCGGLAETMGDPFRHLSDKSTLAWKIERVSIHAVLVVIALATAYLWIDWSRGQELGEPARQVASWYGFLIGAAFAGVIGVGFYPLLGSRVWCRFGCPLAAILGIFQRCFSRFRITTNGDQCMSCGNCSTYCEMGIDVRAYAQQGENIVRASCVGCGVCAAVCPRGVLKLENGSTHRGRFPGPDGPVQRFLDGLKKGTTIP